MPLIKVGEMEFEAAEANDLKCWPASALEPTLEGYRKRTRMEGFDKDMTYRKYSQRRGRPKGGAVKQFEEGIDQRGNGGRR